MTREPIESYPDLYEDSEDPNAALVRHIKSFGIPAKHNPPKPLLKSKTRWGVLILAICYGSEVAGWTAYPVVKSIVAFAGGVLAFYGYAVKKPEIEIGK